MVEGVRHLLSDQRQGGIEIAQDFTSVQPNDAISVANHIFVPRGIPAWSVAEIVGVAIDLDHKPRLGNVEIGNIGSRRVLASNLET